MNTADRARAYLNKLPGAVSGQNGHRATFAAACRLVEFGLPPDDAWGLFTEWNQTHCLPPWGEGELRHKLSDAFRCTSPKRHFIESGAAPRRIEWQYLPSITNKRPSLPPLRSGSIEEIAQLATLRGLCRDGIGLANFKGLLRFGKFKGHPAWFVVDGSKRIAQARRLDGRPWTENAKAWTLPGSQGAWPVGIIEAATFPVVALVEGGPDLLAAAAFIFAQNRQMDCAPVAMLGGTARIHAEALPLFGGKRVRLFPHVDNTGHASANRWSAQLASVGADVDAFSLAGLRRLDGKAVKDLCDLANIHEDDFTNHRCLWTLFP